MLSRAFFSTLSGWGAYAVLIQPDLALIVTALALVAEVSIASVLWGRVVLADSAALPLPSLRLVRADGWMPTCGTGTVPHLILLSQPRR
jgi:hypothetical protein